MSNLADMLFSRIPAAARSRQPELARAVAEATSEQGIATVEQIEQRWTALAPLLAAQGSARMEVVRFLQKLEGLPDGLGRFIVGRKTHPSRFQWFPAAMQKGGITPTGGAVSPTAPVAVMPASPVSAAAQPQSGEAISHTFRLRPDFVVQIELPADFNTRDVERLSAFLKNLPFD